MTDPPLFVFVEGSDDRRFFERVLYPLLEQAYHSISVWEYAERQAGKVENFLNSVVSMGADYIFLADINHWPCVTGKKADLQSRYEGLDPSRVIVVIKEIEGWYFAGLDEGSCRRLGVPSMSDTNHLQKQTCEAIWPEKFDLRTDFMQEVLKQFQIDVARRKNASFAYFADKFL